MSERRSFRWATTSARIVIGTAAAVGFAVVVVTAVAAPWPSLAREPVSIEATPAPAANVLACTGGPLALGRDAVNAGTPRLAAEQSVTAGTPAGDRDPAVSTLTGAGSLDQGGDVVVAAPADRRFVDLAAAGSAVVSADDLRGYAASACRPPLMESWLIGGATTTGSTDIVLLANPGVVPATVQLTVYGLSGPVVPPGGAALVVPAGSQLAVPLAGLALGDASPVVRVTATGAPVTAALQSSLTRTLVPVGLDQIGAVAGSDTVVVVPGVAVTSTAGAAEASTLVRILSPVAEATATVTVTRPGSREPVVTPSSVPLAAGTPTEVDLSGLPVGQYTVRIEAGVPVVGAVRQVTGSGAAADFAWYAPAPAISVASLFATPAGPAPTLALVNDGDADATVVVTPRSGGSAQQVTVPAHGSAVATLSARTVYLLDPGSAAVHAEVSISGDGALAAYPVWSSESAARAITVYP